MTAAIVTLRDVFKRYTRGTQSVEVLHGVSLDVNAGEFVAIMGPSGSGKTTLLNLVGGLDRADSGEVTVAGVRLNELAGAPLARWRARHIGFVFQFYHLLPVLSATKNVEIPLLLTKLSAAQRRKSAQTALSLVGLSDRASHKPAELSGGQQQRVAIARAIVADPTVLLCDEPTGDLDRQTADEVLDLLAALNREHGKTIIVVTHDPRAAARATRQLNVDKGQLLQRV